MQHVPNLQMYTDFASQIDPDYTSLMLLSTMAGLKSKGMAQSQQRMPRRPIDTSSFACGLVTTDKKRSFEKGRPWAQLVDFLAQWKNMEPEVSQPNMFFLHLTEVNGSLVMSFSCWL